MQTRSILDMVRFWFDEKKLFWFWFMVLVSKFTGHGFGSWFGSKVVLIFGFGSVLVQNKNKNLFNTKWVM